MKAWQCIEIGGTIDRGVASPAKCDGGASQLSSTVANLYAIFQYGPIKLFTLYFLNKSAL